MKGTAVLTLTGVVVAIGLYVFFRDHATTKTDVARRPIDQSESEELDLDPQGADPVSPRLSERTAIADDESTDDATGSVESEPVGALTEQDVALIRENLDALWKHASREKLMEGFTNTLATFPHNYLSELHSELIAKGEYEILDHPKVKEGTAVSPPDVKQSSLAHGLVRATVLEDGSWVKTELELNALGQYASQAVELHWFELALARSQD